MGVKLVRGAYIQEEKVEEKKLGCSIIWSSKQETDQNYNQLSKNVCGQISNSDTFIAATHNNQSFDIISELFIDKPLLRQRVYFATLMGLNNELTFKGLDRQYQIIKGFSFGEDECTIPFLIRRGIETKDILINSTVELDVIQNEIKKRLSLRNLF